MFRRRRISRLIWLSLAGLSGCAPLAFQHVINDVKAGLARDLEELERDRPEPPRCVAGFLLSPTLYVTNLAITAEQAGLRRGDRMSNRQ
jgi:hypothetical protein